MVCCVPAPPVLKERNTRWLLHACDLDFDAAVILLWLLGLDLKDFFQKFELSNGHNFLGFQWRTSQMDDDSGIAMSEYVPSFFLMPNYLCFCFIIHVCY